MMRKSVISLVIVTALLAGGCTIEPPLYLRTPVNTELVLATRVDIRIMWQPGWETVWGYNWNEAIYGQLGYRLPGSMRVHIYGHDASGALQSHVTRNFVGDNTMLDIYPGTYDFLFHNNDSEAIRFTSDGEYGDVWADTRDISRGLRESSPVYTMTQKLRGMDTKADEMEEEPVSLPPEDLFSVYVPDYFVSGNLEDYTYENGRYILKIERELLPATYIYLFQVTLLNNDGRVVGSSGGAAVTGMAGGANLTTRVAETETVSVPMDVYFDRNTDMMGAKVYSFGIPGCNAYDTESVAAAPQGQHYFVLNVSYVNGTYKNIRVDVTDEVRALPLGGVIPIEIDVNDFPPEGGSIGGGGFNALVGDWDEKTGSTTILN